MIRWLARQFAAPEPMLASLLTAGPPPFRCFCGAPSAHDEPVLCHSCRDRQEGKPPKRRRGEVVSIKRRRA